MAEDKPNTTLTGETIPRTGEKAVNKQAVDTKVSTLINGTNNKNETYNTNPDEIIKKKGLSVYKTMLRDDQIKANVMLKKVSRLSTDNTIEDASNSDRDKEIGEFVRWTLYEHMNISMRNLLFSMLSAMDYGFALAEKNYEYITEGKWKGYVTFKNITPKDPEGFLFDLNDDGTLKSRGILQNTSDLPYYALTRNQKKKLPRFRTDKFVHYAHMSEFNNPYGTSDLKSAYRSWISKDVMLKYWMMYLERHGSPLPVVTIQPTATPEEVDAVQNIVSNLHTKSSITLPELYDIKYLESIRTAAPGFEDAIAIHNGALDRSSFVPQLMGLSGGKGTGGSYGLGKTQYDVFIFYEEYIGLQLEDMFMRQIIKDIVDLNYKDVDDYPKFKFESIRRETRKDRATMVTMLTQAGIIKEYGEWIYNFIGLPIPKSAMPVAGEPIMPSSVEVTVGGDHGLKNTADNTTRDALDTDRDTRLSDPEERSVTDGTNPYVDKEEVDSTNG